MTSKEEGIPGGALNLDLVLKAHSGDADRVDRAGRPSVILSHPRLTIGLSPQPSVLQGATVNPAFRGRGLLGRFLYFLPSSSLGYRTHDTQPMPDAVQAKYNEGLDQMLGWSTIEDEPGQPSLHTVRLSKEAYEEWKGYQHLVEIDMRLGGRFESCTDWAGKAPGALVRIAGVLHGIEHSDGHPWDIQVSGETMSSAAEIMFVIEEHTIATFDLMGADKNLDLARYVWSWVQRNQKARFSQRDAFTGLPRFKKMEQLYPASNLLEERGYIQEIDIDSPGPGRPPSPKMLVRKEFRDKWK